MIAVLPVRAAPGATIQIAIGAMSVGLGVLALRTRKARAEIMGVSYEAPEPHPLLALWRFIVTVVLPVMLIVVGLVLVATGITTAD